MEKKRILCFGDSLTWGFDPETRTRFPEDVRWTGRLKELLGSGCTVIEEGQPGRTIACDDPAEGEKNALKYILPCLESHTPLDLMILMLGVNNLKQKFNYSSMDVAGEMQIFLEKVLQYNHFRMQDRMKILLISPPLIGDNIRNSWLGDCFGYERAGKVCPELADWYKQLADMYGCSFLNAAEYVKSSQADSIHMDAENHAGFADMVCQYIKEEGLL